MAKFLVYGFLLVFQCSSILGETIIVATAPNLVRLGNEETVLVTIHNSANPATAHPVTVALKIGEDVISEVTLPVSEDNSATFTLFVDPENVPSVENTEAERHAVFTISCPDHGFNKEKRVLLSSERGFFFIQTDKPIYTPNQSVRIRLISLNQKLSPLNQEVQYDIVTPQDVVVKRKTVQPNEIRNGVVTETFQFPGEPAFGNWSIMVHYGKDMAVNRSVQFEVKEYVLPTFSVKITPPKFILPNEDVIEITVDARYVYQKSVRGRAFLKFGVLELEGETVIHHSEGQELLDGSVTYRINPTTVLGENWFEDNKDCNLYLEVTVVEDATGHFENASDISAKFVESPYFFSRERTVGYFKPGLPFEVMTDLKLVNGEIADRVPVKVVAMATIQDEPAERALSGVTENDENGNPVEAPTRDMTKDLGQVNFRLYVPPRCTSIRVALETDDADLIARGDVPSDNNARFEFAINPYESPGGNDFLVVRTGTNIRAGDNLRVDLFLKTTTVTKVSYYVLARGKIIHSGRTANAVGTIGGFTVNGLSYEAVPSIRIVAYFISDAGFIIADSVKVAVTKECENPVSVLPWKDERKQDVAKPQDTVNIKVSGVPGTTVSLLAVDKAVLLLRDFHKLTRDKMYSNMDDHDIGCGPGGGRNSESIFKDAGVTILTNRDFNVEEREGLVCSLPENNRRRRSLSEQVQEYEGDSEKQFACQRGHRLFGQFTCTERAQRFLRVARARFGEMSEQRQTELLEVFVACCERANSEGDGRAGAGIILTDPRFINVNKDDVPIRNDFRESWAWMDVTLPNNLGEVVVPFTVPGSITTWSLQAFGLHDDYSMCVIDPKELIVSSDLFIQLHMPYSVVRKERVEILATVFNYGNNDLVVRTFLQAPPEVCSEGIPDELSAEKEFIVETHNAVTVTYVVIGIEVGEWPIKVLALTPQGVDGIEKKLRVVAEGIEKVFNHAAVLNPRGAALDRSQDAPENDDSLQHCGNLRPRNNNAQINCLDLSLPSTVVPGTESCHVSVTGSPLGPIITKIISGLESLIRQPTGCGEQTMLGLAPDVYVLRYLKYTESGSDAIVSKALSHIQSGIIREQNYRRSDGSFSAGSSTPGNTWLTAFVAKVFCHAAEFTFVDTKVTCGALKWILTNAQRENGAFYERRWVYHKEMTGGIQGDASQTAFALIAMSECECHQAIPELTSKVARAQLFLEEQLEELQRPYVVAIVTYALALLNSDRRFDANEKLKSIATYNPGTDTRFWGTDTSSLGGNQPYWYTRRPSAISVETTGYALLAQIALGEITYSHAIVNWLTQQQNYGGGFVSTQDTVIALQSLSEFSTLTTGGDLDMQCNVTAAMNYEGILRLGEKDVLLQKTEMIPQQSIRGKLLVQTQGEGLGTLNVEVRYNEVKDDNEEDCLFDLRITTRDIVEDGAAPREENAGYQKNDKVEITVCASYLGEERTSMGIIDVGLFSGFVPDRDTCEDVMDDTTWRFETSGRSVIFYTNHIPRQTEGPLCVTFQAVCDIKIGNLHQAAVKVYDYYNPSEECTRFYAPSGINTVQTVCVDETCACVSSQCTPCNAQEIPVATLQEEACKSAQTYVYQIEVTGVEKANGFAIADAIFHSVIKRGDDQDLFENDQRQFWASDTCDCPSFKVGRRYLIIGSNAMEYEEPGVNGAVKSFRYIIDNTSIFRRWRKSLIKDLVEPIQSGRSNCG